MVSVPTNTIRSSATISPVRALQGIANRNLSGRLIVHEAKQNFVGWQLHLGDGQLHYGSSLMGQRELLAYMLCRVNSPLPNVDTIMPPGTTAYSALCQTWRKGVFGLFQLRNLLRLISQETLVHVTAMPSVEFQFRRNIGLDPIVWSSPPDDFTAPLINRVQQWKRLRPYISSPFQRLHLSKPDEFKERFSQLLPLIGDSLSSSQHFIHSLEQSPCFYELAVQLNVNVLRLAKVLKPIVAAGAITLHPFAEDVLKNQLTVMCIDDSQTVQRKVRLILESQGYRVVGLTDPLTALSSLVREKPALVFLDITMPNLDGYELCRMLRRSPTLQDIPIVMLTGRDGFIDRVRAKMVGASGYITKPFNSHSLTDIIQKFVRRG